MAADQLHINIRNHLTVCKEMMNIMAYQHL